MGLLTADQAAERLHISERTLRKLRQGGLIRYVALTERKIRYREEDCDAYLSSRVREETPCPSTSRKGSARKTALTGVRQQMYSDWQASAQKEIARLMADVPADTDWKERQRILRSGAQRFHGGTSWGKKVWAKHCKAYLAMHGKPPPAKEVPLFAADITFPFRGGNTNG